METGENQDEQAALPDIKAMKRGAFEAKANHLQLSTLILQMFDLHIKGRMNLDYLLKLFFTYIFFEAAMFF